MILGSLEQIAQADKAIAAAVEEIDEVRQAEEKKRTAPKAKQQSVIEVWEAQVWALVGEKGKTVRAIEELSGARISIPKEGWVRQVVIRGDAASREEAEKLLCASLPITTTLDVPAWKVGALLGYKGETIREIQEWSHATVSVPRSGDVRTVVITGPTERSVGKAEIEIERVLKDAKTKKVPRAKEEKTERLPRGQGNNKRESRCTGW